MKFPLASAFAFIAFFSVRAGAMFVEPEEVPVRRLLAMAKKVTIEQPQNAEAHFTLGRTHYLAFVSGTKRMDAYLPDKDEVLPRVETFQKFTHASEWAIEEEADRRAFAELKLKEIPWSNDRLFKRYMARLREIKNELRTSGWLFNTQPESEAAAHIREAVGHFQTAIKLAPKRSIYALGYASLLEQARLWYQHHPAADLPPAVRVSDPATVREAYRRAWSLELSADLKDKKNRGMFGAMDMVSYEAGKAFVRLAEERKAGLLVRERVTLAKIRKSLRQLEAGTGGAMTPIIFTTRSVEKIDELLAPNLVVDFPLRGYGPVDRWPWVRPDTALLVWNPSGSGRVASGAQLFGGYTWELFWKTGYEPLAVLDTDKDGGLRGPELAGLAAWFDTNGNGVSDAREVQSLSALGVCTLATAATTLEGPHPMNPRGITFADGRVLPTWDWIAVPFARKSSGRR